MRFPAKSTFSMLSLFKAILNNLIVRKIIKINKFIWMNKLKHTLFGEKT